MKSEGTSDGAAASGVGTAFNHWPIVIDFAVPLTTRKNLQHMRKCFDSLQQTITQALKWLT
jgi:hypothetical protein